MSFDPGELSYLQKMEALQRVTDTAMAWSRLVPEDAVRENPQSYDQALADSGRYLLAVIYGEEKVSKEKHGEDSSTEGGGDREVGGVDLTAPGSSSNKEGDGEATGGSCEPRTSGDGEASSG